MNTKKEKPILFSTPMVRAIIAGKKTMTRRVIKPQPDDDGLHDHTSFPMSVDSDLEGWWGTVNDTGEDRQYHSYQIGDILWVRETFTKTNEGGYIYRADPIFDDCGPGDFAWAWTSPIFMPREAARIFLKVKYVWVERLQDITYKDMAAEGIAVPLLPMVADPALKSRVAFAALWDTLNAKRGYGWDTNPCVWVYEFMRIA